MLDHWLVMWINNRWIGRQHDNPRLPLAPEGGLGETIPHKAATGDPQLAWSSTQGGQIRPELLQDRDRRMGVETTENRRERQDLAAQARRQAGPARSPRFAERSQFPRGAARRRA